MNRHSRATYWPWVCGLACLFALSITAPRLWEDRARQRALRQAALVQKAAQPVASLATPLMPAERPATIPPVSTETSRPNDQRSGGSRELAGPLALARGPGDTGPSAALLSTAGQPSGASDALGPAVASDALPDQAPAVRTAPSPGLDAEVPAAPAGALALPSSSPQDPAVSPAVPVEVAHRPAPSDRLPENSSPTFPSKTPSLSPTTIPDPARGVAPPAQASSLSDQAERCEDGWTEPAALWDYLDDLLSECETGTWALEVQRALRTLRAALFRGGPSAAEVLDRLRHLGLKGWSLAEELQDPALATKVRRACYALERRQRVWEETATSGGLLAVMEGPTDPDPQRLALCLGQVDALFQGSPQGKLWSQFLTLDALGELASRRAQADPYQRRRLARAVLDRLAHVRLDGAQRQVIQHPALIALREELRLWASEPAPWATLLREIERYEATGLASDGRQVAERIQQLALSPLARRRQLAEHLAAHYRNANVRIAASAAFLNRLIPERPEEMSCVEDCVLGRPVRGQRITTTEVAVRLIPDTGKLRLALQVDGQVESLTRSVGGAARFINASQATYSAWKELEISPDGMRILPAQVCVHNQLRLRGISTDWDGLPLLGALAQELARSGHEFRRCEANAEIEAKVYARAKSQVDAEADARLGALAREIREQLLEPLAEMSLGPQVLWAETTEQRLVLRARLAAEDQLAAHTPRPMAPGDSLASVQIHESALTNLVARMGIDGQTLTLAEIRKRLAERLKRPNAQLPLDAKADPEEQDLTVTFAPRDALRLRCADGQVVLTVAIARLVHNGKSYEDFQVRAVYRPQASGLEAQLVRDDVIHLSGPRLSTRAQFTLRGIFTKAFSRHRPWALLPERITREHRLEGLTVTQLVAEDGWLGVAIGPARRPNAEVACRADR